MRRPTPWRNSGPSRLDPAALDTVARALSLPLGPTPPVQKGTQLQIGVRVIPDAGAWAFQAKVGEISPIIETPIGYYLFRLDSLTPEGVPPLDAIREAVMISVAQDKKIGLAAELAQNYLRRVREGSTMEQAAKALGIPYRNLGPFSRVESPVPNPILTGAVFSLPIGAASATSSTRTTGCTWCGSSPGRRRTPRPSDRGWTSTGPTPIRRARQDRARNYLEALRAQAKVVDRREGLFPTSAQAEAAATSALGQSNGI